MISQRVRWCFGTFFILFFVAGLAPAFAQDGPKPKLFLLPTYGVQDSVSSIVPERIGEMTREGIARDTRIELMPTYDDIRQQLGGSGYSSAAVAEAEKLYNSGIGLLTAGEDKKAVESFSRALEMMEQNLGDVTNFDILADTIGNLSLAYFNAGFDLDARKTMQKYAHVRPNLTLDVEKFPKELVKIYDAEAKKVKSAGPGTLEIVSGGAPGIVTIDGVDKGKTPAKITDVGFGYHYLVVRDGLGGVWTEQIRVRGKKKKQTIRAELKKGDEAQTPATGANELPSFYRDLLTTVKSGSMTEDIKPYLDELASTIGADAIGWVLMQKKGSEYVAASFVYHVERRQWMRGDDVGFNIELSNLVIGVNAISKGTVDLAVRPMGDKIISEAELGEKKAPVVVKKDPVIVAKKPEEKKVVVAPVEPKPSESNNTWTYVGVAAGSLVAVGLVAGGIWLLTSDDGGSSAPGFNAEVSW